MKLEEQVMGRIKEAMKAKDEAALRTLRAIKSEILKERTAPGAAAEMTETEELKMLQRMAKQRKDSLQIFEEQGRDDLAAKEREELEILQTFLPQPLEGDALREAISQIIQRTGATSQADMGKVMGAATKELAGRADGKEISAIVRELLK